MVKALRGAIQDGRTGQYSSKRLNAVVATGSMALVVVLLGIAACMGRDVAGALASIAWPLAALGGINYVGGKFAEGRGDVQSMQPRAAAGSAVPQVPERSASQGSREE
jgi:hypothetical protein